MIIKELYPAVNCTIEFTYSNLKRIPHLPGSYVMSNFEFEIIYIGKASDLNRRFYQHIEDKSKKVRSQLGSIYWFSYYVCQDKYEISRVERGWLNNFELHTGSLPIFNKIHAGL